MPRLDLGRVVGPKGDPGEGGGGSGDMAAAVYDPTGKKQDVYAYADAAGKTAQSAAEKSAAQSLADAKAYTDSAASAEKDRATKETTAALNTAKSYADAQVAKAVAGFVGGQGRVEAGSYVGDGEKVRTLKFAFPPKAVFIRKEKLTTYGTPGASFDLLIAPMAASTVYGSSSAQRRERALLWGDDQLMLNGTTGENALNEAGVTYYYVAVGNGAAQEDGEPITGTRVYKVERIEVVEVGRETAHLYQYGSNKTLTYASALTVDEHGVLVGTDEQTIDFPYNVAVGFADTIKGKYVKATYKSNMANTWLLVETYNYYKSNEDDDVKMTGVWYGLQETIIRYGANDGDPDYTETTRGDDGLFRAYV